VSANSCAIIDAVINTTNKQQQQQQQAASLTRPQRRRLKKLLHSFIHLRRRERWLGFTLFFWKLHGLLLFLLACYVLLFCCFTLMLFEIRLML